MAHLRSCEVRQLLHNKFVVVMGDAAQRAVYKDLVLLLQRDALLSAGQLQAEGEPSFEGDALLEGGGGGAPGGEVRQFRAPHHLLRLYCLARAGPPRAAAVLRELRAGPHAPDLLLLSSRPWRAARRLPAFRRRLRGLFALLRRLPAACLRVWHTALPAARGPPRPDLRQADACGASEAARHGLDVLDLHFHFRRLGRRRLPGGRWDARAHRRLSQLLLAHVADAWGVDLPRRGPRQAEAEAEGHEAHEGPDAGRLHRQHHHHQHQHRHEQHQHRQHQHHHHHHQQHHQHHHHHHQQHHHHHQQQQQQHHHHQHHHHQQHRHHQHHHCQHRQHHHQQQHQHHQHHHQPDHQHHQYQHHQHHHQPDHQHHHQHHQYQHHHHQHHHQPDHQHHHQPHHQYQHHQHHHQPNHQHHQYQHHQHHHQPHHQHYQYQHHQHHHRHHQQHRPRERRADWQAAFARAPFVRPPRPLLPAPRPWQPRRGLPELRVESTFQPRSSSGRGLEHRLGPVRRVSLQPPRRGGPPYPPRRPGRES
ncbi:unnamed protein product [Pipistrellus nathusii]|uniref:Uncharacterized protein n=1 Tax=Pipistrellus nathusii TaxID=59473 RepID=A0ABP0AGZ4_PIPNA